jgi:hypothetical protein
MTQNEKNELIRSLNDFLHLLYQTTEPKTTIERGLFYEKLEIIKRNLTSIEKQIKKL